MNFDDYLRGVRTHLIINHGKLLHFFALSKRESAYPPENGGWTASEILEHVALTSHYLLILIDKAAGKANRKADGADLITIRQDFISDPQRLDNIGRHKSFAWERPAHMEPTGNKAPGAVADQLNSQLLRCLLHLEELAAGEGLLHTTSMSVDDLGRLNVYEYIDFLSRHVERHITQISNNLAEIVD